MFMLFQMIRGHRDHASRIDSSERVVSYSTPYLNDLGPLLEDTDKRLVPTTNNPVAFPLPKGQSKWTIGLSIPLVTSRLLFRLMGQS